MSADAYIPADPLERARLTEMAGLTEGERRALEQWCYDQQRERAQGVVPEGDVDA